MVVTSTNDQTLSYKPADSSHFRHQILPIWWKHEARNEVLEGGRKGAAQAAARAGVCLRRGHLPSFYKANAESRRISLPGREKEELTVLRASADAE